jgi:hypothetical protein
VTRQWNAAQVDLTKQFLPDQAHRGRNERLCRSLEPEIMAPLMLACDASILEQRAVWGRTSDQQCELNNVPS